MGLWKSIKKRTLEKIRGYATKVGDVTNSDDVEYFTPQNTAYWIFVGLFFLCFVANRLFYGDVQEPKYFGAVMQDSEVSENKTRENVMVYRKLSQLFLEMERFQQVERIKPFLLLHPGVLDSVPSAVPLFREHYVLSSPYGKRYHPVHQISKKHFGVDLAAAKNTPIYATAAGKVIRIENSPKGHGLHIVISHAHGFQTLYGHMESVVVVEGEAIGAHDFIGTVGSTGISTGPHLHYEVIKNGRRIDPTVSFNLKYEVYLNLKNPNYR
ncbi:M23 family metallopeptidase [Costertonia aggregata]|uniref:M23 family metallopeptidase n=1 Tax=Costertonia aggregata TaxID=343403 RepID=A0A7H9ATR7_9FLAO|nr:M23 family metallopeptidase [Costertonia aggregata]QLG46595.1 M23 family metallopeptidase [Costertonia aggregata]